MEVADGNPYSRFVALGRGLSADAGPAGDSPQAGLGAAPARMRLGKVISAAPLSVRVAGVAQPASALKVNERLVKGARWRVKLTASSGDFSGLTGPVSGPVETPHGQGSLSELTGGTLHSTGVTIGGATAEQLELDLEAGDEVLLLTEDDQIFYILMKVVDAV